MSKKRIGVVADDITGANDIGIMFSKNGFRSIVVPMEKMSTDICDGANVVIVDTDSRFDTPETAAQKVITATKKLMNIGFDMYHNKTCSVFRGNIGAEFDAMQDVLGVSCSMIVLGLPKLGRTTVEGIHYLYGTRLDKSSFVSDPVHPTHEASLQKILAKQSSRNSLVFPAPKLDLPQDEQKILLTQMKKDASYVIFDVRNQKDLQTIARLIADEKNICGSSGIAEELPAAWNQQAPQDMHMLHKIEDTNGALVLAGSLTEASRSQINFLLEKDWANYRIEPEDLLDSRCKEQVIHRCVSQALSAIRQGRPFLIYTQNDPVRIKAAKDMAKDMGLDDAAFGKSISLVLGAIARTIVDASGCKKIVVAGGDTSKAVSVALDISHMLILQEIEPGVPAMYGYGGFGEMLLAFKSGSFGSEDFLERAVRRLEGLQLEGG